MKKALLFISLIFTLSSFAFSEVLTYLKGRAEADAIMIEWQSGNETGVTNYTVERSEIKSNDYEELTTIAATGSNSSYHFRDAQVNEAANSASGGNRGKAPLADLYKYRIKINYIDAVSYSSSITVTRPSSGVKRTWGMIKEMFR